MKTLVVAEKPSAAKDLMRGLEKYGKFKTGDRFYESDGYVITWAQGHVLSIKEPRDYDNWTGSWDIKNLPWYPPNNDFKYKVPKETKDVFNKLKPLFSRKDISEIINATDAGREGDLIFWEIYDYFGLETPVKRFYESAVLTPSNVQRIIENDLKDESFHLPRKDAAYARAFADLLLGMNFTIGFTSKAGTLLNIGRVKTPTLGILAQRRKEIDNFKEDFFFEVEANFDGGYKGQWFKDQLGNTRLEKKEEAEELIARLKGKDGTIVRKEVEEKKEHHKLLFSLTSLQQEASKKFGYDPSRTLEIAQSLYETHKILSYPRSESEVIGTEHVKQLKPTLQAINIEPFSTFVQWILDDGVKTTNRMVNDKKLTDHHAIIPTEQKPDLSRLSEPERKVYEMVVKRFLAAFYPPALYERTEIITEVEKETFKTTGKVEVDKGWKAIYVGTEEEDDEEDEKKESESVLPPVEENQVHKVTSLNRMDKKTNPPKLYTYTSLLGVMKNPKKLLEDQELKDALDEAEAGLGTTATRADILKGLINGGYIEKKRKTLDVTELGMKLIDVSPEGLKSPQITAEWEKKLRLMELAEYNYDDFMSEIRVYIEENLDELRQKSLGATFASERGSDGEEVATCPHCKSAIVDKGKIYVCGANTKEEPCFIVAKVIAKKKISASMIKEIASKGETNVVKGFTSKDGKKFDAKLKLDGKNLGFAFGDAKEVGVCPHCGKEVLDKGSVYACKSSSKGNPCFIMSNTIAKKKISATQVKKLLEKGVTDEIKDFTSSKGANFNAKLKLEGGKVSFAFDNKAKTPPKSTNLTCPFCQKGEIKENAKAFGCSNWKDGCKFTVWKNGSAITQEVIKELIENGYTAKIEGLKNKKGSTFSASLKMDIDSKSVGLNFD